MSPPGAQIEPVEYIQRLLNLAVSHNISDVHLTTGARPSIRRAGDLRATNVEWPEMNREMVLGCCGWLARVFLSRGKEEEEVRPLTVREISDEEGAIDTSCTFEGPAGSRRLRVNVFLQRGQPAAAIRLLPATVPKFEQLGLPAAIRRLTKETSGLVIVSGPTGSGKSTTLAALLGEVNQTRNCHIITLEDPVEYVFTDGLALVHQREIGIDAPDFPKALRYILRQDPDVVMVGEMRDQESISSTITAAETGHLVFSTLHADDAPGVISRIIDIYNPAQQNQIRVQLASTLKAVVCQRLMSSAQHEGSAVVIAEIMFVNDAIRNLIRMNRPEMMPNTIQTGNSVGMCLFDQALAEAVTDGRIHAAQALTFARSQEDYERYLHKAKLAKSAVASSAN